MEFIDTHCHLYLSEFDADLDAVMQRAAEAGISRCYLPAVDSSSAAALSAVEARYSGRCIAMAGLHPCSVKENYVDELSMVEAALKLRRFAAVGEIGLDFYWDRSFDDQQYAAFHQQIEWALEYDLPIVIHSRDSMEQSIDVVRQHQDGNLKGIFHCFSGSVELAERIIGLGFYLGIGGVLTYKKSGLAETLASIDLQHLVLETDAPYLTPVPFRGKRNESSYIPYIATKLAEVKGVEVEEVARITTANAQKIFGA